MSQADKLFCLVRRSWIKATPEEKLRQAVLHFMFDKGSYPNGLVALEMLPSKTSPLRRADIVSYWKNSTGSIAPLIVVECKAEKLTPQAILQAGGYNYYLEAPFIALACPQESFWGWFDHSKKSYAFQPGFPTYPQLLTLLNQA